MQGSKIHRRLRPEIREALRDGGLYGGLFCLILITGFVLKSRMPALPHMAESALIIAVSLICLLLALRLAILSWRAGHGG